MMTNQKIFLALTLIFLLLIPISSFASHGGKKTHIIISVEMKGKTNVKVLNSSLCEEKTNQLTTTKFEKYGVNYLIFCGNGVRGFHNIVIRIQGSDFESKITTKSTDRGTFFVPWNISEVKSGNYTATVLDESTTLTVNFKI